MLSPSLFLIFRAESISFRDHVRGIPGSIVGAIHELPMQDNDLLDEAFLYAGKDYFEYCRR